MYRLDCETCEACDGRGWVPLPDPIIIDGLLTKHTECPHCGGDGTVEYDDYQGLSDGDRNPTLR